MNEAASSMTTHSFCAVLLAAGQGSRLGCLPKSLFRLKGETLLARQLCALTDAGAVEIVVVTGFFYPEIEAEIQRIIETPDDPGVQKEPLSASKSKARSPRIRVVRNPTPHRGQQSSVLLGLQTIQQSCLIPSSQKDDNKLLPLMIALADQPLMNADDYRACLAAFHDRPAGKSIVYPSVSKSRGNPVVFCCDTLSEILKSNQDCREYIDAHPERIHQYVTDNDHFIFDLDEARDLEALSSELDSV